MLLVLQEVFFLIGAIVDVEGRKRKWNEKRKKKNQKKIQTFLTSCWSEESLFAHTHIPSSSSFPYIGMSSCSFLFHDALILKITNELFEKNATRVRKEKFQYFLHVLYEEMHIYSRLKACLKVIFAINISRNLISF